MACASKLVPLLLVGGEKKYGHVYGRRLVDGCSAGCSGVEQSEVEVVFEEMGTLVGTEIVSAQVVPARAGLSLAGSDHCRCGLCARAGKVTLCAFASCESSGEQRTLVL